MKILNEDFIPLKENIKFEALSQLREIQSNLVGISFLPVIAIMKETNPLKKQVLTFQDDLDKITLDIQDFISKAKEDVDYEGPEDIDDEEDIDKKDIDKKDIDKKDIDKKDIDDEDIDDKKKKKVEDSSEPTI